MPNAPPSASKELVLGQSASTAVGYLWVCPNRYSTAGCRSVAQALWCYWCYGNYAMDGAVGHPKHRTISSSQAGNAAAGRTEICPGKPVLDRVRLGGRAGRATARASPSVTLR